MLDGCHSCRSAPYRGIEISAAVLMVLGLLEMVIVLLLAVWGLFMPGPGGVDLSGFNPATIIGEPGLFSLGVVFSIFALTGWEGAPLAEESVNPRRIVPQALLGTILIMGMFLVFTAWGTLVGWGTHDLQAVTPVGVFTPAYSPCITFSDSQSLGRRTFRMIDGVPGTIHFGYRIGYRNTTPRSRSRL